MQDAQLKKLVEKIGYGEGMPGGSESGVIDPMEFIHEVIDLAPSQSLHSRYAPAHRYGISQKVAIRFGETIKSYMERPELDPASLTYIPLALAGWCRYLLAVDDQGRAMELSSDPMLEQLTGKLAGVRLGDPDSCQGCLKDILSNPAVFGVNLYDAGLGEKVESMFAELAAGREPCAPCWSNIWGRGTERLLPRDKEILSMTIEARQAGETAKEYAYRIIKENIITLELEPGSTLNDMEISQMIGISRTPVREAIIKLKEESDIIEIFPQRGMRIGAD